MAKDKATPPRKCWAPEKWTHKPVAGIYDGGPILSCAWCGATLGEGDRT
jgi:hypothetical protein